MTAALATLAWPGNSDSLLKSRRWQDGASERKYDMTTLGKLQIGERARVTGYTVDDAGYRHQLLALGLTPGTELDVVRFAPLGDPMQIRVRGTSLFLRKNDAEVITVEKL
jgi:ferrous iron transport protein A